MVESAGFARNRAANTTFSAFCQAFLLFLSIFVKNDDDLGEKEGIIV